MNRPFSSLNYLGSEEAMAGYLCGACREGPGRRGRLTGDWKPKTGDSMNHSSNPSPKKIKKNLLTCIFLLL
jgi:hypothetical protein